MASSDQERKEQGCEVCGQVDTHPRHVTFYAYEQPEAKASADIARKALENGIGTWGLADLLDPTRSIRHIDCCANEGCDVCRETIRQANGAHGDELISTLTDPAFQEQLAQKLEV